MTINSVYVEYIKKKYQKKSKRKKKRKKKIPLDASRSWVVHDYTLYLYTYSCKNTNETPSSPAVTNFLPFSTTAKSNTPML